MDIYNGIESNLIKSPKIWLITGVAGFIGSNLLEKLLKLNQKVIGLDNFSTGHKYNLQEVKHCVTESQWSNFNFVEGDIRDYKMCQRVVQGVDYILHQAALGSVPRSIEDPCTTNAVNIDGFLNILTSAKNENVKSFVYAASSSTYGDHAALPKVEENIGKPLSPYAVTKYVNELYADVFAKVYGFRCIGLRYFNVFGKRQDPNGVYAAVIPKWTAAMIAKNDIFINGDGLTSRDFCYIDNVVQMNILAATTTDNNKNEIYNVAVGEKTNLNELFQILKNELDVNGCEVTSKIIYRDFRAGDVRHSLADISKAKTKLGYFPKNTLADGIKYAMPWYIRFLTK